MSLMVKRRIKVQMRPKIILRFPSTTSSAPMLVVWMPLLLMKSKAIFAFSNFCTRNLGLEAYLPSDSSPRISRRWMRTTWQMVRSELALFAYGTCTYPIGQVLDQILNLNLSGLQLAIEPLIY